MIPPRVRYARAALAAPLLVLAACGGGDDERSAAPDSGPTTPTGSEPTATDTGTAAVSAPASAAAPTGPSTTADPVDSVAPTTSGSTTTSTTTSPSDSASSGTSTAADADVWRDPAGVFAIAFPAAPTEQQLTAELDGGGTVAVTAYLAELPGAAAVVGCVDSPSEGEVDAVQSLTESQNRALEQFGAELVDSDAIELQGRPGLQFRGAIGESGGVLGRTYVDGLRVCNMLVVGEPAIVDDVAPPFLDSFEFLQEAA